MKHSLTDFSPIFPELNTQVFCPQNIEEVYDKFKQKLIISEKQVQDGHS